MIQPSHGLRLLCISFLAAGALMAVGAGAAQAKGEFKIGGQTLEKLGLKEESVKAAGKTISTSIPALSLVMVCTTQINDGGTVLRGGEYHVTYLLSSCTVIGCPGCHPQEPIVVKALGTMLPISGKLYEVLKPSEVGQPYMTINFPEEEGGGLPEEIPLTGSTAHAWGAGESVEQTVTYSSEIEKLTSTGLSYLKNPASLSGETALSLSGANKGKIWGVTE
ncbi:MAG: hypothetical protein ACRDLL_09970 [Solirubrobacterales bacterium]